MTPNEIDVPGIGPTNAATPGTRVAVHVAAIGALMVLLAFVRFLPLMLNASQGGYWCEEIRRPLPSGCGP